eukprot:Gb_31839 [translate_table: standard]
MANSTKFIMHACIAMLAVITAMSAVASAAERNGHQSLQYTRRALISRLLNEDQSRSPTCTKNKNICLGKDIEGNVKSECCNDRCANVLTDRYNCGGCNKVCDFQFHCCNGKCLNVAYDTKNCGKCGNQCKKGSKCVYGMCAYA